MRNDKNYMIAMHNPATIDHPNLSNEFVELRPVKPPGILYDSVGYNSTVERIRRLANETKCGLATIQSNLSHLENR